ncbi:hypothetical protein RT97_00280 [Variovorax paradoxus]|uniref:Uncharacterized protein n=1 Tax=Variovorax paradoxus TaxID=34073 RepID=A0A0D0N392_VARPD|nr:hypothetical protein [Variovorax paradoxus]KIQ37559.1 hypothetical protein RT97_00280 [Variovorax paradoxus]
MKEVLDQLEASLKAEHYYLSLMVALTIPDIASGLQHPNGAGFGKDYAEWFERWVHPQHFERSWQRLSERYRTEDMKAQMAKGGHPFPGAACYSFRCSFLHHATTQHFKSPWKRIMFIEPGVSTNRWHYTELNDAMMIDLPMFCEEVVAGARQWLEFVKDDEHFIRNNERSVRRYVGGIDPYIVGVDVIS